MAVYATSYRFPRLKNIEHIEDIDLGTCPATVSAPVISFNTATGSV